MSDAKVKAVRCEYRHEWSRKNGPIECAICGHVPTKAAELQTAEAILHLREVLKPGDTVFTVLRSVSRSGMSRNIDLYYMAYNQPVWISAYVGHAIGSPQSYRNWQKSQGLTVGGCGMDMGYHLVESLSYSIYPTYKCLGKRGEHGDRCPSNYHTNYRRSVRCDGVGTGDDWNPCYPSSTLRLEVEVQGIKVEGRHAFVIRTPRIGDDGIETICPTCKGEGSYPNPEGAEKFNLTHKDGYALRHKWL